MNRYKNLLQGMGIFVGILVLLWLFLIAASAIPNKMLKKNMEKSALYYTRSEAFARCDGEKMNGIADNYADSIWVNVAWFLGKGNPVVSSVDTKYYDGEQQGQNIGLYLAVTNDNTEANTDYTRYWHGTAGVIRVLHLFTDVNGIKYIGFVTAMALAAAVMILLIKDGKDRIAVAFFLSLCIVKIWNIRLSMEYQPAFILGFLFCILYLWNEKKGNQSLLPLAAVSGVMTSFFDFLTTETVAILLPLILVITVRTVDERIGEWKENAVFVVIQGIVWLMSYGITFLVKWILASVVTGENKFAAAFNLAEERMNGIVHIIGGDKQFPQIFAAPAANLSTLFGGTERIETGPLTMGILLLICFIMISVVFLWKGNKENRTATMLLFLLGMVVLVRYMVLNNHSYLHAFFTYRGLVSLVLAMLSMIMIHNKKYVIIK